MTDAKSQNGFCPRLVFEGPTDYLKKLRCHVTTFAPQAGYAPHKDPYDVVIVVLAGEVETLGQRTGPHSVIFYAAGEPHGMRNPSLDVTARYVVFEFHG
jgi:quercetin dioxygenase-like cupin family protein